MTIKCSCCGKQLNENNRIKLPYSEGLHCPHCGNTVTFDEIQKNSEDLFDE